MYGKDETPRLPKASGGGRFKALFTARSGLVEQRIGQTPNFKTIAKLRGLQARNHPMLS